MRAHISKQTITKARIFTGVSSIALLEADVFSGHGDIRAEEGLEGAKMDGGGGDDDLGVGGKATGLVQHLDHRFDRGHSAIALPVAANESLWIRNVRNLQIHVMNLVNHHVNYDWESDRCSCEIERILPS